MIRSYVTALTFMTAFSLSVSYAATYTWTDEQGTVHFTEDQGNVPKKFRTMVRTMEDEEPSLEGQPASPAPSAQDQDATLKAAPIGKDGKTASAEIYAGKTFSQWEKDFREREAAMTTVRERLVEISDLLKDPKTTRDVRENLRTEDTSLRAQFNEMKAQYYEQVEIVRKAGMQFNIQK